jgi:hypothetical protein
MQILPKFGQSNIDLCIQATGGLDNLVKFCNESLVNDLDIVNGVYNTKRENITNISFAGLEYKTALSSSYSSGLTVLASQDGNSYLTSEDGLNYLQ